VFVSVLSADLSSAAWLLAYYLREEQATEVTWFCTLLRLTCMPATLLQV